MLLITTILFIVNICFSNSNEVNMTNSSSYIIEISNHDGSFNQTLSTKSHIFLEFYTKWCGHCKALDSALKKTSKYFRNQGSDIVIAKIDAGKEENKEIAAYYKIEEFPSFLFISGGEHYLYKRSKTKKGIISYLKRELNYNISKFELKLQINDLTSHSASFKKGILLLVCNNIKDLTNIFIRTRRELEKLGKNKVKYLWKSINGSNEEYNIQEEKCGLVFYNYLMNESRYNFPTYVWETNEVRKLVKMNLFPLFTEARSSQIERNLGNFITTGILFYNEDPHEVSDVNSNINKLINQISPVADKYKSKIHFLKANIRNNNVAGFYEIFQFKQDQLPNFVIFDAENSRKEKISKFKFYQNIQIERDSFEKFINEYLDKTLQKFTFSEAIPKSEIDENGVHKLVRNSIENLLTTSSKYYIILFCLKETKDCQIVKDRFYSVSRLLSNSTDLIFGEYDTFLNENDLFNIKMYPELIMFRPNSHLNNSVTFKGNYTTSEIIEFIDNNYSETLIDVKNIVFSETEQPISQQIIKTTQETQDDTDEEELSDKSTQETQENNEEDDDDFDDEGVLHDHPDIGLVESPNKKIEL